MSKRHSKKRKRRSKTLPVLGLAGVSLSMAGGACASTAEASANTPPPTSQDQSRQVFLGEEEIADVSLATFYVFDKENTGQPPLDQHLRLARGGGGCGCGGGGGCGHGCGCGGGGGGGCMHPGGGCGGGMGCGHPGMGCGHPGIGGCGHPGVGGCGRCRCGGFFFRRCFGCGCGGCGCGGCGTCWIWTPGWGWVYTCWADSRPPAQAAPSAEVSRVASEQSVQTTEIAGKADESIVATRTK